MNQHDSIVTTEGTYTSQGLLGILLDRLLALHLAQLCFHFL